MRRGGHHGQTKGTIAGARFLRESGLIELSVNEILDEIENLVVDGKHIVFTNKSIIEEPELVRLVDDLRNELPIEMQNAKQIMDERDTILNEARDEAEKIIAQAKEYAEKLVDESAVVRQSQEKASLIMEQAKAQEKEIFERSTAESLALKTNASQYATQVFDHLVTNVGSALNVLQQAKTELARMPVEPVRPVSQPGA